MRKLMTTLSTEELQEIGVSGPQDTANNGTPNDPVQEVQVAADCDEAAEAQAGVAEEQDNLTEAEENVEQLEAEITKVDEALGEKAPQGGADESINETNQTATDTEGTESTASDNIQSGQEPVKTVDGSGEAQPTDNPELAATVAQEALRHITARMGLDASAHSISHESIKNSPMTSLRLSREALSDVLNTVIQAIKQFFQRLWAKLKVYVAKVLTWFANYSKQLTGLKTAAEALKADSAGAIADADKDALAKRLVSPAVGEDLNGLVKSLITVLGNINGAGAETKSIFVKALQKLGNAIGRGLNHLGGIVGKPNIGNSLKPTNTATNEFLDLTAINNKLFGKFDYESYYEVPKEGQTALLRLHGGGIVATDKGNGFSVSKTSFALKGDTVAKVRNGLNNWLTKKECLSTIDTLKKLADNVKADNDAILKAYDEGRKDVDAKIAEIKKKVDGDNAVAESARATLTSLRRLSLINALVLPELLFLRMDCFKTCIYTVSKSIAAIEKSSKLK